MDDWSNVKGKNNCVVAEKTVVLGVLLPLAGLIGVRLECWLRCGSTTEVKACDTYISSLD